MENFQQLPKMQKKNIILLNGQVIVILFNIIIIQE